MDACCASSIGPEIDLILIDNMLTFNKAKYMMYLYDGLLILIVYHNNMPIKCIGKKIIFF